MMSRTRRKKRQARTSPHFIDRPIVRELISRAGLVLLACAFAYPALRCMRHELLEPIACLLLIPAAVCTMVALIPTRWLYRMRVDVSRTADARDWIRLLELLR